jgi:hypothetical protein
MFALTPGGAAGFKTEKAKKNGSIEKGTALPLASVSRKLLVPGVPTKRRSNVVFVNRAFVPSSALEALKMP